MMDWIPERLESIGRTRADLARALGFHPAIVTRLIKGERRLKAMEIPKLAEVLNLPVAEVMERIESSGAPEDGVCRRLAALRNRAGLSMAAVAKALGMANASSYQRYEDPAIFTKKYLPLELAERLAEVLGGYGDPPIQVAEVMALAGVTSDDPAEQRRHRLRLVMEKHNLTPAEWAKKAGVVSNVIYNFLNGHSDSLSAQTMEKLERAIGIAAPGDIDESEPMDAMLLRLIVSAHRKIERLEKEIEALKRRLGDE
jgi:transcriptional regulator with XRE-family HTH domain